MACAASVATSTAGSPAVTGPPNGPTSTTSKRWIDGGRTDLDNLVLLCRYHHVLCHEGGWTLTRQPDGTITATKPEPAPRTRPRPDTHTRTTRLHARSVTRGEATRWIRRESQAGVRGPGRGVAGDGGSRHGADLGEVVVGAVVLDRDVVPEGDGAGLPVEAGLELGELGVAAEEVEERVALGGIEADDLAGEEPVHEQGGAAGAGMADHHGVLDRGHERAELLEPVAELVGVGADAPVVDGGERR